MSSNYGKHNTNPLRLIKRVSSVVSDTQQLLFVSTIMLHNNELQASYLTLTLPVEQLETSLPGSSGPW